MLKIFRRIRIKLLQKGYFKRYLIYALGEILLVMIGILLALQVNNWNEERKARHKEMESLSGLETNLDKNIEYLQESINFQNFTIQGIDHIISHLQSPALNPSDSLLIYYSYSTWYEQISVSTSTYESLKYNGFEIIKSGDIKDKIIELFEVTYSDQEKASSAVGPVYGLIHGQMAIKNGHIFKRILSSNEFEKDDAYFELLNFMEGKKKWKIDFLNSQKDLLEKTITLKAEIANYLSK